MPAHRAQVWNLDDRVTDATARPIEPLYTYADVASSLRVSVQTVEVWVKQGRIPSPLYIGHTARFTLDAIKQIRMGVQKPQTYPVADSPRAANSRAGKTKVKEAKRKAAAKITRTTARRMTAKAKRRK